MSIPPNDPSRGCASNFAQPVGEEGVHAAQNLTDNVNNVNCVNVGGPHLNEIVYRPGDVDCDIRRPVYRWDTRHYQEIFAHGFQARSQGDTPNNTYYNLVHFVQNAGAPLDSNRPATITHAFVSTTLNNAWQPNPSTQVLPQGGQITFYRYEVYAPGGIWVAVTLGDQYQYSSQAEVCFVRGIAPQYIRSCLVYTATRQPGSRYPRITREIRLIINGNFNPQSAPYAEVIISLPVYSYWDEHGTKRHLPEETYTPDRREKRQVLDDNWDAAHEWYTHKVVEVPSYINAAFRSSRTNEAYLFMKNKYVLVNYAPGSTDDRIVNGPHPICDGFPSLIDTPFGEQGIDCAFDTDYNEAFIFSDNLCARIDYAPGTTDDKILSGPMTIAAMFPFFKNTAFEHGIDAAFRSTTSYEAYLFRGEKYALINYHSKRLIAIRNITDGFSSLLGTVFERGIDAAFASHREDEAYLFKGELYALINFAPATTDDYIIGGKVKHILTEWPSLRSILPLENKGLDSHDHRDHAQPYPDQHDEI